MEQELEKEIKIENQEIFEKSKEQTSAFKGIGRIFFEAFYQWAFGRLPDQASNVDNTEQKIEDTKDRAVHNEISQEFDRYLNNGVWNFAVEFIENGYQPSKNQHYKYKNMLIEVIKKNNNFTNELIKIMPSINEDIMMLIVKNNGQAIFDLIELKQEIPSSIATIATISIATSTKYIKSYHHKKLSDLLLNTITQNEIPHILSTIEGKILNNTNELLGNLKLEYSNLGYLGNKNVDKVEEFTHIMDNAFNIIITLYPMLTVEDLEKYKNNITSIENKMVAKAKKLASCYDNGEYFEQNCRSLNTQIFDNYQNKIQEIIQKKLLSKKDEILRKIKSIHGDQILEKKINHSIHSSNISVKQELPTQAQNIIKNINEKYDNFNKSNINQETRDELKKLYEIRIPEILKKFLVIDKEYRIELKNVQGKNAQELMLESLKNIEDILDKKLIEINESRLSDLSVTQRYTSAIKNKM